ncbi:MAG: type VI secretion system Vgr family protein [Terracidiphilus sp.]
MPQHSKATNTAMAGYETFDYPGRFTEQPVGNWLSRLRLEAEETATLRYGGAGTVVAFGPGQRIKIAQSSGAPAEYLLTEVRHQARAGGYTNTQTQSSYANSFVAIPFANQFRPPRLTPKPVVHGVQTATVVSASAGDPIQTDIYGRIKVHFHWDRRGKPSSGDTSCWLRVSQFNTGSHWGTSSIPHAGQEVVVGFLEGDPDRPLVVGRVHNAEKMPPLNLPADKHKTVIRDHGNNRMIMRGQAGQEHLTMVSPRRVDIVSAPEPAKPLSSGATPTAAATSIPGIAPFQDPTSYSEMVQIYNALTSPPTNQTAQTALSSLSSANVTDASLGPDAAVAGDINGYAQGNSNTLCLGNMNDWVGSNYSEWVAGNYYEQVAGTGNTTILGNNTTTIGAPTSNVNNFTFVWGRNLTQVGGANISTVEGDNTATNLGAVDTFNVGGVMTLNAGGILTMNPAAQLTLNGGLNLTVNGGPSMTVNDLKVDNTGTRVDNMATLLKRNWRRER